MTRQLSLTVLIFGLLGTAAWADGMVQSAPTACCEAPFAGAYIGAAVGYGAQRVEVDNLTIGQTFSDEDRGVTFGGYVGYNWQHCCDHMVYGIEADFNYLDASPTAFDREPPGPSGLPETTSLRSKMDWFGTLRARAGVVVHDHVLLYGTGGLAYARVDHTLSDDCVGCGNSAFNLGSFTQSNSETKFGWTVGGGAELLHDSNWLIRAEALYVDLGSDDQSYLIVTPAATGNADTTWDDQFWVARIGIAYKFSAPDCCAAPLK
jgi:outer membrane immunogenic protein